MLAALAANDAGPRADVLFVAHQGYEAASSWTRLLSGELAGRCPEVGLWRVAYAAVPAGERERAGWLWQQWERMDDFVNRYTLRDRAGFVRESPPVNDPAVSSKKTLPGAAQEGGEPLLSRRREEEFDATTFLSDPRFNERPEQD